MKQFVPVMKRELLGYFRSPVAYVFIVIFLAALAGCTFFLGNFYRSNEASLEVFFAFHPWLFLFLIPAIGMRLWAEERRSGTIELLFTLPISMEEAVLGKFAAAWIFIGISLALTFPMIITAFYLGEPDGFQIFIGYLGSFLMAGAYLAVTSWTSSLTKNQVVSFILSVVICLLSLFLGWGVFAELMNHILPGWLTDLIATFSFTTHFQAMQRGLLDSRDVVFFASVIILMLMLNMITLESKKSL